MMTLAALALLATAPVPQGVFNPTHPIGPIVVPPWPIFVLINFVDNPGFEAKSLGPWEPDGKVDYLDPSANPNSPPHVSQSLYGAITTEFKHSGKTSFRMNSGFPGYVIPGCGLSAKTSVRQVLSAQPWGGALSEASVWVQAGKPLTLTIEYTAGNPTVVTNSLGYGGWERWDFLSAIDKTRTVKAIRFDASNRVGSFGPQPYDDV